MKTFSYNRFEGGMADSLRTPGAAQFAYSANADPFVETGKLQQLGAQVMNSKTAGDSDALLAYLIADTKTGTDSKLYGKGQNKPTNTYTKIFRKDDVSDPTVDWALPANATGNGANIEGCFELYGNYFWGFQGTNQVFKYGDITSSPTITDSVGTVGSTITSVANGTIGRDTNLYLPYNNKLVRITSAGAMTDNVAPPLPAGHLITSTARFGNYIAIGIARSASSGGADVLGKSLVYLWDMASTEKYAEILDWGDGALMVLENLDGYIVGISDRAMNSLSLRSGAMVIRMHNGGSPQIVRELANGITSGYVRSSRFTRDGRLFFCAKRYTIEGTKQEGVWVFGRKDGGKSYGLTLFSDYSSADSGGVKSISSTAGFLNVVYGTTYIVDTTSSANFGTMTYETPKLSADGNGKLRVIVVSVAPQANTLWTLKYKKDHETSWTTLATDSVDYSMGKEVINIESTGKALPTFDEIQFQYTGSNSLVSIHGKFEELNTQFTNIKSPTLNERRRRTIRPDF